MTEVSPSTYSIDFRTLEQLIADLPDAVFVSDGDGQRYLLVNEAAERLVGYRREELLQLQPRDLTHPEDAHEIEAVVAHAERRRSVRRPWRVLRKDGSVVQTEMTLTRCRIDGHILMQGILRVFGDGMLDSQAAVTIEDARLSKLDRTSLAIVTLDPNGVVTSWNAGATERFQLTACEAVGRQVQELARNEKDRADVELLMRPHQERDAWVSKLTIRLPDDEYEALVTCSAIRSDEGALSGFLLITAPLASPVRTSASRMRRARVQCAACGREVAGTMRRKYCSEKCRQWAYYHRHLDAQRERSRQRHGRRRGDADGVSEPAGEPAADADPR